MKHSYKIPASLDTSYLDMKVTLQKESGVGLRPMPMRQLAFFIMILFSCLFFVQKSFVGDAGFVLTLVFIVLYIGFGIYLGLMDSSQILRFEMLPAMFSYMQPDKRKMFKVPISFYNISSIDNNGRVYYADGSCGYVCAVVGTASALLFDSDKESIINRVDTFWRKQTPGVEYLFITVKKSQDVTSQRQAIRNYDLSDPDLKMLAKQQDLVLKNYVGEEFKSLHQYMFIKAQNVEVLKQTYSTLSAETENSSYFIKRCIQLSDKTIVNIIDSML